MPGICDRLQSESVIAMRRNPRSLCPGIRKIDGLVIPPQHDKLVLAGLVQEHNRYFGRSLDKGTNTGCQIAKRVVKIRRHHRYALLPTAESNCGPTGTIKAVIKAHSPDNSAMSGGTAKAWTKGSQHYYPLSRHYPKFPCRPLDRIVGRPSTTATPWNLPELKLLLELLPQLSAG